MSVPNAVLGCTNATVVPRLPGPRRLVDDPVTVGLHPLERRRAVVHPVPNVVESLTLRREILRDRRIVAGRGKQLNVRVGNFQQRFLDAVALDDLAMLHLAIERGAVVVDRGLEIVDGNRDMVDLGEQHADGL